MDRPLALFQRFLWDSESIIFVYCAEPAKIFLSMQAYQELYQIHRQASEEGLKELKKLLVSAALCSASQTEADAWAWTLRLPFKAWGLFCASESDGSLCGHVRPLSDEAAQDVLGAINVQRMRPGGPLRQSTLIPRDEDARASVEQYFEESEQLPMRLCLSDHEALMALALPEAKWKSVHSLSDNELLARFHQLYRDSLEWPEKDELWAEEKNVEAQQSGFKQRFAQLRAPKCKAHAALKLMHESVAFYGCHCNEERMHAIVASLAPSEEAKLWDEKLGLEIQCPRCLRMFRLSKKS